MYRLPLIKHGEIIKTYKLVLLHVQGAHLIFVRRLLS